MANLRQVWRRLTCDWQANSGRLPIQIMLLLFRFAQILRAERDGPKILAKVVSRIYHAYARYGIGVDLPVQTVVGPGLRVHHGQAIVVNGSTVLGAHVQIRQSTTLGARYGSSDSPSIGDGVDIGSNSVVLGRIVVGANARIGAGSVVLKDVEAGDTVAGVPARSLRGFNASAGPTAGSVGQIETRAE